PKVIDVLGVSKVMRDKFTRASNITELRIKSVQDVADCELQKGRYLNQRSAEHTIMDACGRRVVGNLKDFDRLVDEWLRHGSTALRDELLDHCAGSSERAEISNFFNNTRQYRQKS
ncbi:MAG: hypothetical protein WAN54_19880, partial [Syntrophobacteraceae bacterium]